jgi:hypothetical protein
MGGSLPRVYIYRIVFCVAHWSFQQKGGISEHAGRMWEYWGGSENIGWEEWQYCYFRFKRVCIFGILSWDGKYVAFYYRQISTRHSVYRNRLEPEFTGKSSKLQMRSTLYWSLISTHKKALSYISPQKHEAWVATGHVGGWPIAGDLFLRQACLWINRRPCTNSPTPKCQVWPALIRPEGVNGTWVMCR